MEANKSSKWIVLVLSAILLLYLYPLILTVLNSFKTYREMFESFISWPTQWSLANYSKALDSLDFMNSLKNSLLLTVFTVVGVLLTSALAGYKISRSKSRLSGYLYSLFIFPYLIPFFAYMIPVVQMANTFSLNNNILGVALINIGTTGSFALLMMVGFVKSIPLELDEAGSIDGCNEFGVFFRIILPLLKPVVSTVAIIYSLWTWNEFLVPFLLLSGDGKLTLVIKMYELFGTYGSQWDVILASMVLISLPIVLLYVVFQRQIIGGLASGAVKG